MVTDSDDILIENGVEFHLAGETFDKIAIKSLKFAPKGDHIPIFRRISSLVCCHLGGDGNSPLASWIRSIRWDLGGRSGCQTAGSIGFQSFNIFIVPALVLLALDSSVRGIVPRRFQVTNVPKHDPRSSPSFGEDFWSYEDVLISHDYLSLLRLYSRCTRSGAPARSNRLCLQECQAQLAMWIEPHHHRQVKISRRSLQCL